MLKRTTLIFNDKECVLLNFQDLTAFKNLQTAQKKEKLLTTLYSSVHHEMMGPLKNNVQMALRLTRSLKDQAERELAQMITICSRQVLLHANDLLDL